MNPYEDKALHEHMKQCNQCRERLCAIGTALLEKAAIATVTDMSKRLEKVVKNLQTDD